MTDGKAAKPVKPVKDMRDATARLAFLFDQFTDYERWLKTKPDHANDVLQGMRASVKALHEFGLKQINADLNLESVD